jgi:acyl dehydratase
MPKIIDARETRFGGYIEDYEVGDLFRHWPGKTVTEADDHLFCLLTMATHPLHIDSNYAATMTPSGRNIVVGTFVYSLLLGMSMPDISGRAIANLGTTDLRHVAPLFHGDTLYGESEVLSVRLSASRPNAGILVVRTRGVKDDGTLVCQYERAILLPRRSTTSSN